MGAGWRAGLLSGVAIASPAPPPADRPPQLRIGLNTLFGTDNYPPDAMRAREEGSVSAKLRVDARGHVTDCAILQSSGSRSLDHATCVTIQRKDAPFEPARDENGKPVASDFVFNVRWQLPDTPQQSDPSSMPVAMRIEVARDGRITACEGGMPMRVNRLPRDTKVCVDFAQQVAQAIARQTGKPPEQLYEGRFLMDFALSEKSHEAPPWPQDMVLLNDMSVNYAIMPDHRKVDCKRDVRVWVSGMPLLSPCDEQATISVDQSWPRIDATFRVGYRFLGDRP